ncbi:hypothetical protein, partial [Immundisolibacter sp.]
MTPGIGLRARLALLLTAALLPLVGLGTYNGWTQFENVKASARGDSLELARRLAARQERDIDA